MASSQNNATDVQLKYTIKSILGRFTASQEQAFKREIIESCSIHEQTFKNWLRITLDSKTEIPSGQLQLIAKVLKVKMDELFTIKL